MRSRPLYISLISALMGLVSCSQRSQDLTSVKIEFPDSLQIVKQQIIAPEDCKYILLDNGWIIKKIPTTNGILALDVEDLKHAGMHKLIFISKKKKNMGSKWVYIKPQRPSERLETYLSYPYVIAGSPEKSEIVNIATDIYGNLMDNTPEIQVNFKSDKTAPVTIYNSKYNYNTALFSSSTVTGQTPYSISTVYAYSGPKILYIESNKPQKLRLEAQRNNTYADGQSTVELQVKNVKDAYGNTCEDGTNINLEIESEEKKSRLNATVVQGEARTQFIAPHKSGTIKIYAYQDGKTISNIVNLSFKPIQIKCTVHDTKDALDLYFNSSNTHQEIEDGTPTKVTLSHDGKEVSTSHKTEDGKIKIAKAPLDISPGIYTYTIEILDTSLQGNLEIK